MIKEYLAEVIQNIYPDIDAIGGVATAGIPQGALVADALNLPFIYVRAKAKGHGMGNKIEGRITAGQKVVLVEDLVSTGGSSLQAAEALRELNVQVEGMMAIFTYGFDVARDNFINAGIPLTCLSDYNALLKEALERNYIDEEALDSLQQWRKDPASWAP
jgi:orotate phosphoribosyltransferase